MDELVMAEENCILDIRLRTLRSGLLSVPPGERELIFAYAHSVVLSTLKKRIEDLEVKLKDKEINNRELISEEKDQANQ